MRHALLVVAVGVLVGCADQKEINDDGSPSGGKADEPLEVATQKCKAVAATAPFSSFDVEYTVRDRSMVRSAIKVGNWVIPRPQAFVGVTDLERAAKFSGANWGVSSSIAQLTIRANDLADIGVFLVDDTDNESAKGVLKFTSDGAITTYFIECDAFPFDELTVTNHAW